MTEEKKTTEGNEKESRNFIEQIIDTHIEEGKHGGEVHTRFPPEPNGYLHIGHAKSICLNFGLGKQYNGKTNLRFDDTNPTKEDVEYVDSIKEDVQWLGFQWEGQPMFTSDYFQQLYDWAVQMIKDGKAYVDFQSADEIASQKGTPTKAGDESPYRNTSPEENLEHFEKMKNGEYDEGHCVLRAKIDMASSNMHMRDPLMYRINKAPHHRTGDKWKIYPMYDYAHGQSDYIEGITHSVCTLEFENHKPLYNWFLDQVYDENKVRPQQYEFARLNMSYTVMSKRRLLELVQNNYVNGWDDPRMPTVSGMRRRGYPASAIRAFAERIGVAKRENIIDLSLLEFFVRENLNKEANRVMCVLDPVKLVIENYPEDKDEVLMVENNPEKPETGKREVPFSREIYIERNDFMEDAPKKFFRLSLDKEVRLKGAYIIKGERVEKDENGNITTIYCTYDTDSKSGSGTEASNRKVKGILHWVSAKHAVPVEVRQYDRLFSHEAPDAQEDDFKNYLNENSLEVLNNCMAEPSLKETKVGEQFQFQRLGYFCVDKDSTEEKVVFNRTSTLKDGWGKKKK